MPDPKETATRSRRAPRRSRLDRCRNDASSSAGFPEIRTGDIGHDRGAEIDPANVRPPTISPASRWKGRQCLWDGQHRRCGDRRQCDLFFFLLYAAPRLRRSVAQSRCDFDRDVRTCVLVANAVGEPIKPALLAVSIRVHMIEIGARSCGGLARVLRGGRLDPSTDFARVPLMRK